MDSIKHCMAELSEHFNKKMAEFHYELKHATPATSPTSNINAQFSSFRAFVLTVLQNLQSQVELLARQQDELDMRSRKKMLLVHGVAEGKNEDTSTCVAKHLSVHIKDPVMSADIISRAHRLGRPGEKPRAIIVKFKDISLRNKVWYSKTSLKGSGITISEFLTRGRHAVFLAARERFGVSRCWTKDGIIIVLGPDGTRHRVVSLAELKDISSTSTHDNVTPAVPSTSSAAAVAPKDFRATRESKLKSKRFVRK